MPAIGLTDSHLTAPKDGPKRILTIEGGGVRGAFSLQILRRTEQLLREHFQRPEMVLADHFHLIAGTSVGAILATFLSKGWSVERLQNLFDESLHHIFSRALWWKLPGAAFRRGPLRELLQRELTDASGGQALFGSQELKTWLLIVMRNLSTGSPWPLLNHPASRYNRPTNDDGTENLGSNLRIPLWQMVRASTAAPWFFPPERVTIAPGQTVEFIDGGIGAYNNPSVIAYLMATLPCYPLLWEKGIGKLQVISVGTGHVRAKLGQGHLQHLGRLGLAGKVPGALIESTSKEQDLMMRCMGQCEYGEPIDREIGTLTEAHAVGDAFRYSRYNKTFTSEEVDAACKTYRTRFSLSAVQLAPWLQQQGLEYAKGAVKLEHLV